jgi:hypothetical protein
MTHHDEPITEEQIEATLKQIGDEADAILRLFDNGRVPVSGVPEAQKRFRKLKEHLDAEYRRMATIVTVHVRQAIFLDKPHRIV